MNKIEVEQMRLGHPIGMRYITLYVPQADVDFLDELVRADLYANRSEAIRLAIKDLINLHLDRK